MPPGDRPTPRPLNWSLMALWIACVGFVAVVAILGVTLIHRVDTIAQRVDANSTELARRTGVITEIDALREEIARMRTVQLEKAIIVENNKNQVLANVLAIDRLEKQIELLKAQLEAWKAPGRAGTEPAARPPRAPLRPLK